MLGSEGHRRRVRDTASSQLPQLRPVNAEGRIFLTFEAKTYHHDLNEGFEGVFTAEGSAIVQFGKKVTLADLGDEPLTVTATVEE